MTEFKTGGAVADWATYGVAQRPTKKNEDKFLIAADGTQPWADFCCGVLDGHNGRRAAETCTARLVAVVTQELKRLEAATGSSNHAAHADASSPNWHPQLEAALMAAFVRLDSEIKTTVPDGTTASLVLLKRAPDGGVGVKVAWVGDSRAVLARYVPGSKTTVVAMTRDHKASDVMEAARIEAFYAAINRRPSMHSDSEDGSYHGAEAAAAAIEASQVLTEDMLSGKKKSGAAAAAPATALGSNSGSHRGSDTSKRSFGNSMEEEVGLAFANMQEFDPSALGINVSKDARGELVVTVPPRSARGSSTPLGGSSGRAGNEFAAALAAADGGASRGGSMHGGQASPGGSVENSHHGPSELNEMRGQLSKLQASRAAANGGALPTTPTKSGAPRPPPPKPPAAVLSAAAIAATQAAAAAAKQRDRRSFVARLRDPETGALSNLRLFGGNVGASTAMTRSIGDANAARCCIAEPEFFTQLVAPGQRARILIASDGLWDVYANEEAEQLSRGSRLDAPRSSADAAAHLVAHALDDRAFDGLAPDDITALVVDIHGGGLPAGGGEGGCCTLM